MSYEPIYAQTIVVPDDVDIDEPGYFVIRQEPGSDKSAATANIYVLFGPYETEDDADAAAAAVGRPDVMSAFFPGIEAEDAGVSVH